MGTRLDKELKTYERNKVELLAKHEGKYVLIKGEEVVAFYTTPKEASNEGVSRFDGEPFLVKRIAEGEEEFDFDKAIEEDINRFDKAMKKLAKL